MKSTHPFSLCLGIALGLLLAHGIPFTQHVFAQSEKKEILSPEEIDKRLDEVIETQKVLKKRTEDVAELSRLLKATAGKGR